MFCPNCGKAVNEEQLFCRACGSELGVSVPDKIPHWLKSVGVFALGGSLFLVFCIAMLFFLGRLGGKLEGLAIFFLLTSSIIFSGIISALLVENRELRKSRRRKGERKSLEGGAETVKLLEEKEAIPPVWSSVIENTTEKLLRNKRTSGELR